MQVIGSKAAFQAGNNRLKDSGGGSEPEADARARSKGNLEIVSVYDAAYRSRMRIKRIWIFALGLPTAFAVLFLLLALIGFPENLFHRIADHFGEGAWYYGLSYYSYVSFVVQYGTGFIVLAVHYRHESRRVLIGMLLLLALAYALMFWPLVLFTLAMACTFLDFCV